MQRARTACHTRCIRRVSIPYFCERPHAHRIRMRIMLPWRQHAASLCAHSDRVALKSNRQRPFLVSSSKCTRSNYSGCRNRFWLCLPRSIESAEFPFRRFTAAAAAAASGSTSSRKRRLPAINYSVLFAWRHIARDHVVIARGESAGRYYPSVDRSIDRTSERYPPPREQLFPITSPRTNERISLGLVASCWRVRFPSIAWTWNPFRIWNAPVNTPALITRFADWSLNVIMHNPYIIHLSELSGIIFSIPLRYFRIDK